MKIEKTPTEPEPSSCKWKASGKLKAPRKGLDISFWRFILLFNWSSDWTWARIDTKDDLVHTLIGIQRTERMLSSGKTLSVYTLTCFKLLLTFGIRSRAN